MSYNSVGGLLYGQGRYSAAEETVGKALAICLKVKGSAHPDTVLSYVNLAYTLNAAGKYEVAEKMALAGAKSFQAARLRVTFTGLERLAFSTSESPMSLLACLLARNGKPAQAWDALEKDLGRGLFDDLAARTGRLSNKEGQSEEILLARLNNIDKRMLGLVAGKDKGIGGTDKLRKERDALMLELTEFKSEMVAKYGVLAGEVYDRARVQESLAADAAFIAWIDVPGHPKSKNPAGDHWACLVRAKGDPVWVRLKGAEVDGSWKQADDELPRKVLKAVRNSKDTAATDLLADLYQQRLEPLEPHLKAANGLPPVKHLIVLPSSAMIGFPVEALTDRYLISYSPSATLYAYLRENRREFDNACDLLALADPAFTEEQFQTAAGKDAAPLAARVPEKTRLPGTKGEVEAIVKLIKARGGNVVPLFGTAANGKNLDRLATEQKLKEFRYLHLATHGTPDAQGGMNSFLALAAEDFKLSPYDKLTAGHILRTWKLDADLVTLSACETGLGQYQGGEGYVGFSQALFLAGQKGAGVRTIVMSQWQVNDVSTALLMERFYQNLLGQRKGLKEPMGKLAALTEARQFLRALTKEETLDRLKALGLETDPRTNGPVTLEGRRPFVHPYYWAPFILVGDAGTTEK